MLNVVYAYVNLIYFKVRAVSHIILTVNPNLKDSFYIGEITIYHLKLYCKLHFTP